MRAAVSMPKARAVAPKRKARKPVPMVDRCHDATPNSLAVVWPIRLETLENKRECWQAKHRRAKQHRDATERALFWSYAYARRHGLPFFWPNEVAAIHLTRLAPRSLDPGNLEASFKHVQDGVAAWLRVDDSKLRWHYAQEKCRAYGVRIRIELKTTEA